MDNKKFVLSVVFGAIVFVILQQVLLGSLATWVTSTIPTSLDPTAANLTSPRGYIAMIQAFHILSLMAFIVIMTLTILMAIGDKESKRSKIYSYITLGLYGLIVLFLIISRCIIPDAGVAIQPSAWDTAYSTLYTPFRAIALRLLLAGGILTALASWQIWVHTLGGLCSRICKKDKTAKEPKIKAPKE